MTKGQTIGWSIGIGVFLLLVVVLVVLNKDKISGALSGIAQNQPTTTTYPDYCDKERFGYDIYGNANSDCGVIASEPYSAPCDPDRPGYDINGFPRTDCGLGKTQNPSTNRQGTIVWKFTGINDNGKAKIATGGTDPQFNIGQKVIIRVMQGPYIKTHAGKVLEISTARKAVALDIPNVALPINNSFTGEIISA